MGPCSTKCGCGKQAAGSAGRCFPARTCRHSQQGVNDGIGRTPYRPAPLLRPGQAAVTCQILRVGSPRLLALLRLRDRRQERLLARLDPDEARQLAKQSHTTDLPWYTYQAGGLTLAPASQDAAVGRAGHALVAERCARAERPFGRSSDNHYADRGCRPYRRVGARLLDTRALSTVPQSRASLPTVITWLV
jgi:hypothetical protein